MTEKTVPVSFRIPPELRDAFAIATAANDQTASQAIRQMMRAYITEAAQTALMRQIARKAQGTEDK